MFPHVVEMGLSARCGRRRTPCARLAVCVALVVACIVACAHAQNLPVPPLPYEYDALEPVIDEATMRVHHLGHHAAYTRKLNDALHKLRKDVRGSARARLASCHVTITSRNACG